MSTVSGFEIFVLSTLPFLVLLVGGLWGAEPLHFGDLLRREKYDRFPSTMFSPVDMNPRCRFGQWGSRYFEEDAGKRFLARLKNMVGGNIKNCEALLSAHVGRLV